MKQTLSKSPTSGSLFYPHLARQYLFPTPITAKATHDDLANVDYQSNDKLGNVVTGCSFTGKDRDVSDEFLALSWRSGFDGQVSVNNGENVKGLTFVLVSRYCVS